MSGTHAKGVAVESAATYTLEDHKAETLGHIDDVCRWMAKFATEWRVRYRRHDKSKLNKKEAEGFTAMNAEPRYPFNTPEYNDKLARYAPLLDEHYRNNDHHPEYWKFHSPFATHTEYEGGDAGTNGSGVSSMSLPAVQEMLCDWRGRYGKGEGFTDTIGECCKRFGIGPQLHAILLNTAHTMGMLDEK